MTFVKVHETVYFYSEPGDIPLRDTRRVIILGKQVACFNERETRFTKVKHHPLADGPIKRFVINQDLQPEFSHNTTHT